MPRSCCKEHRSTDDHDLFPNPTCPGGWQLHTWKGQCSRLSGHRAPVVPIWKVGFIGKGANTIDYSPPGHPNDHRDRPKHCQKVSLLVALSCWIVAHSSSKPKSTPARSCQAAREPRCHVFYRQTRKSAKTQISKARKYRFSEDMCIKY